jgi:RNA recognition motif-containing protein
LSYHAPDETIRGAFEPFGETTSARVIKDKNSDQSREFGFLGMSVQSQVEKAIKSLKTTTPDFNTKSTAFLTS